MVYRLYRGRNEDRHYRYGLDTSHQSFDNGAYEYALEQNAARAKESVEAYKALDLLDADEINEKLSLLHIKEGVSAADLYRQKRSHTAIATSTKIWT